MNSDPRLSGHRRGLFDSQTTAVAQIWRRIETLKFEGSKQTAAASQVETARGAASGTWDPPPVSFWTWAAALRRQSLDIPVIFSV